MKKIISKKEQFENAVKDNNAKYVDEVCSYAYYYAETANDAWFGFCNEETGDYGWAKEPKFEDVRKKNGMAMAVHFVEQDIKGHEELKMLNAMTIDDLRDRKYLFTTYCDFLFANSECAINGGVFDKDIEVEVPDVPEQNIIGAEHTDVNAISGMTEYLRNTLIVKIEDTFKDLELESLDLHRMENREHFNDINAIDNQMRLVIQNDEVRLRFSPWQDASETYPLSDLFVEELLCIYSQLHK